MKDRKKNKTEKTMDANHLHEVLAKCGEACKNFHASFFDYEMDVSEMGIRVFLDINRAAVDYRYALLRAKQPKVGDRHNDDTTCRHFYEDER